MKVKGRTNLGYDNLEELQKSWVQLKEERDTFKAHCQDYERRLLELTGQLQEEQQINTFLGAKRKRPWETGGIILFLYFCFVSPNEAKKKKAKKRNKLFN